VVELPRIEDRWGPSQWPVQPSKGLPRPRTVRTSEGCEAGTCRTPRSGRSTPQTAARHSEHAHHVDDDHRDCRTLHIAGGAPPGHPEPRIPRNPGRPGRPRVVCRAARQARVPPRPPGGSRRGPPRHAGPPATTGRSSTDDPIRCRSGPMRILSHFPHDHNPPFPSHNRQPFKTGLGPWISRRHTRAHWLRKCLYCGQAMSMHLKLLCSHFVPNPAG
jgi:hypothetical protein